MEIIDEDDNDLAVLDTILAQTTNADRSSEKSFTTTEPSTSQQIRRASIKEKKFDGVDDDCRRFAERILDDAFDADFSATNTRTNESTWQCSQKRRYDSVNLQAASSAQVTSVQQAQGMSETRQVRFDSCVI